MNIKVVVETIVGDHDGECSGDECVDTVTRDEFYFKIPNSSIGEDEFEIAMDNPRFLKILSKLLDDPYENMGGGSGYCSRSDSGLKHQYRRSIVSVEEIIIRKSEEVNDLFYDEID